MLQEKFSPRNRNTKESTYVEVTRLLVTSVVIVMATDALTKQFNLQLSIGAYVLLIGAMTCVYTCAYHYFDKHILHKAINLFNQKTNQNDVLHSKSIWEDIFYQKELPGLKDTPIVAAIEKDGARISCGYLQSWSNIGASEKELLLANTTEIAMYFDYDAKQTANEDKFFARVLYEYNLLEQGLNVKIYDATKYVKFATSM